MKKNRYKIIKDVITHLDKSTTYTYHLLRRNFFGWSEVGFNVYYTENGRTYVFNQETISSKEHIDNIVNVYAERLLEYNSDKTEHGLVPMFNGLNELRFLTVYKEFFESMMDDYYTHGYETKEEPKGYVEAVAEFERIVGREEKSKKSVEIWNNNNRV